MPTKSTTNPQNTQKSQKLQNPTKQPKQSKPLPKQLKKGDNAPDFSLPNAQGAQVSLKDFGSKIVVLYFYPKDNTSGCTIEAQDFSERLSDFLAKNAVVIGISPDSTASHQKFIDKYKLAHILLSDSDRAVASAYFAYGKKMMYGKEVQGIIRSTFVIQNGKILNALYNVKAKGHAQAVLEMI
ncbi:peroxiredoxin [Helicobacter sp. T3_23-1059]